MDSTSGVEYSRLITQLRALAKNPPRDDALCQKLYDAAQSLAVAVETPGDTVQRIAYSPLQLITARIAGDLSLFQLLAENAGQPLTLQQLTEKTKADQVLLRRILQYLVSMEMIKQAAEDQYSANNITNTLAYPGLMAGIYHNSDSHAPSYQALPKFLASTGYENPSNVANCAFQIGHNTDKPPFVWVIEHPEYFHNFNVWMSASREGQKTWLDVVPFEKEFCQDLKPDTPLFVDVGGGIGQQCLALKTRFPNLPGRIILQEMPQTLPQVLPVDGMEKMAHDFWTLEPVQGARVYYLRNIMHDYPDEKCIIILQQIMKAMNSSSVIAIDDMILPNCGASWRAAALDMTMMASMAAMERTEKQWLALLDAAGLKMKKRYTYTEELQDSVILAVPK